jgi:hypothetical protein
MDKPDMIDIIIDAIVDAGIERGHITVTTRAMIKEIRIAIRPKSVIHIIRQGQHHDLTTKFKPDIICLCTSDVIRIRSETIQLKDPDAIEKIISTIRAQALDNIGRANGGNAGTAIFEDLIETNQELTEFIQEFRPLLLGPLKEK